MKKYNLELSMVEYSVLYGILKKDLDFMCRVPLDDHDSEIKEYLKVILNKLNEM